MIKHFTLQFLHLSARKLLTVQHGARLPNQEEKMNEHAQNTGHFFNKKLQCDIDSVPLWLSGKIRIQRQVQDRQGNILKTTTEHTKEKKYFYKHITA